MTLFTHNDEMSVSIPVDLLEEIGVRPLLNDKELKEVFSILTDESSAFDRVWSRRFKDYTTRLNSGNFRVIAGLIRDITRRNTEKKVSYGEVTVLRDAVGPLLDELVLTLKVDREQASAMVDDAILEGVKPKLDGKILALAS